MPLPPGLKSLSQKALRVTGPTLSIAVLSSHPWTGRHLPRTMSPGSLYITMMIIIIAITTADGANPALPIIRNIP